MAVIEICDVCGKKVSEIDGLSFSGIQPMRSRRKYKIRVCDECVNNIKAYCKERKN